MKDFNKVFGIGISRTGTSSLTAALELLGLSTIHWPTTMLDICKYRGATDITVACRFKELDQIFPDSLFIYTERDEASWFRSVCAHYQRINAGIYLPPGAREFAMEADLRIYGSVKPEPGDFIPSYLRHHAQVVKYFKKRRGRLLRLNVSAGDGWPKLCEFLDLPVPGVPFPHLNPMRETKKSKTPKKP